MVIDKMKLVFILILVGALFGCTEELNVSLVGEWKIDIERTLKLLKKDDNTVDKIVKCYKTKLCGNTTFRFTDNHIYTTLRNSNNLELSTEKDNYVLKKIAEHYILEVGKSVETYQIIFVDHHFCSRLEIERFMYYECYNRID